MDARLTALQTAVCEAAYPLTEYDQEITKAKLKISRKDPQSSHRIFQIQLIASTSEVISRLEESALCGIFTRANEIAKSTLIENIVQYAHDYPSFNWFPFVIRIRNLDTLFETACTYSILKRSLDTHPTDTTFTDNIDAILYLNETSKTLAIASPLVKASFYIDILTLKKFFYENLQDVLNRYAENLLSNNALLVGVTKFFLENLYHSHQYDEVGDLLLYAVDNLATPFTFEYDEQLQRCTLVEKENFIARTPRADFSSDDDGTVFD